MAKHAWPKHNEMYETFENPEGYTLKVRIKSNNSGYYLLILRADDGNLIDLVLRDSTYIHSLIEAEWFAPSTQSKGKRKVGKRRIPPSFIR